MKIKNISSGALYQDKNGYLTATIQVNGRQVQKRVKNEAQAKQWILTMELERTDANALTSPQMNDAANAMMLLKQKGIDLSLLAVAEYYVKHAFNGVVTIGEAIDEYLLRTKSRVSAKTLKGYEGILQRFSADVGEDTKVASLTRADAIRWLDSWNAKPGTWMANQRALSKFYNESLKMDFCSFNPFSNLDKPKMPPPKREFLSVEETRAALQSVLKRQPRFIHFLTLGLFAGIRPVESVRLKKQHFNEKTGFIHIDPFVAKSHSFKERMVRINPTLMAWLKAYPFDDAPIPTEDINYADRKIRECAEKDGWKRTHDVFRHTFGTYEFARTGNSAETATMMGHSEAVGMKHYRGRVTKEDALKFFAIRPKEKVETDLDAL